MLTMIDLNARQIDVLLAFNRPGARAMGAGWSGGCVVYADAPHPIFQKSVNLATMRSLVRRGLVLEMPRAVDGSDFALSPAGVLLTDQLARKAA